MLKTNINYVNINNTKLLSDISFTLTPNNIYTIVGNNGSGKSTLLLTMMGMLNKNDFTIDASLFLNDQNLFELSEKDFGKIRKKDFRFIFQDSVSALDPLKKIKYYFELFNFPLDKIENELNYFQLPSYTELKELYPYQLSTGMAQRINIILAILHSPTILLMDEPTSALDLSVANLLLQRLKAFAEEKEKILLIITQDLPFAKTISNFIAKMTNGNLSEFITPNLFFEVETK
jgi:peptide/nickel transport system ATP-binding protein